MTKGWPPIEIQLPLRLHTDHIECCPDAVSAAGVTGAVLETVGVSETDMV
jgi:hypothetical protein